MQHEKYIKQIVHYVKVKEENGIMYHSCNINNCKLQMYQATTKKIHTRELR